MPSIEVRLTLEQATAASDALRFRAAALTVDAANLRDGSALRERSEGKARIARAAAAEIDQAIAGPVAA